jgi:hypothetical protein
MTTTIYVRYQSPVPDRSGRRVGIFGLVNMLGKRGLLTVDEERLRRTTNAWFDSIYVNPMSVDPRLSLAILSAHNLPCERYTSSDPGRIIYQDLHQVVVIPHDLETHDQPTTTMWLPPIPRS